MKQKYLFIFLTVLSAVFACEQIDESNLGGKETVEMVPMSFTAVIEKDADTKTVLGDGDTENLKKVLWQPGDKIGVSTFVEDVYDYYTQWSDVLEFTSTLTESSEVSEFDGSAAFASAYKAFYPYTETVRDSNNVFIFDMPATQKYVNGSFDPEAAPMVAYAERGNDFEFKNVCGIVALKLSGDKAVKSISFSGVDANGSPVALAGTFEVEAKVDEPVMKLHTHSTGKYTVTLDCGEPVQLDPSVAKPFYIMLPPATYSTFSLLITTADGEIMLKSGRNLTIARSHIKPTAGLEYVESVYVDLSAKGTANSYIVNESGLYSFKADVVGNGTYGYVQGESFYPASPSIDPVNVRLLWEDKPGVISGLSLSEGRVNFMSTGQEGNVFIAVTDAQDNILWSWHLWITDQPQDQLYQNDKGNFSVMDRNLGAISAERGSTDQDWYDSRGLVYQWGRKDPFRNNVRPSNYQIQFYLEDVVLYPEYFSAGSGAWIKDTDRSDYLWSQTQKTIYDPCPAGYRVAVRDVWYGFTKDGADADRKTKINASGDFDKGWNFYYDGTNTTWYPATTIVSYWGDMNEYVDRGYIWSAGFSHSQYSYCMEYYYTADMSCSVWHMNHQSDQVNGYPVRCMKDDGYEATKVPQVEFTGPTDVTTSSVILNAKVISEGWESVTDRGFVWGTASDLSDGQSVSCGAGVGDYSYTLSALTAGSIYYVKAYAVNGYTTSYGEIHRFSTRYSDDAENLSSSGTANCYMVRPVAGTYSFDARVKGNSTESLSPVSAELIWEVDGNRNVSDNIVDNARLSDGWILFELPSDVQPGNALIAAKDADGKIVWSWHIWVADFDPVATQHLYNNGAVFMDRNLGAVVNAPDFNDLEGTWASAYGTIYQWGRKDPLVKGLLTSDRYSAFNSIEEANANPTTFAANIPWLSPSVPDLWRPEKTMYDPCPVGWKVPSYEEINGMWYYGEFSSYGLKMSVNNNQISWFGFGDYIHSGGEYYLNNGNTYYWTTNYQPNWNNVRTLYLYNGQGSSDMSPTDAYPVRCMKDE